MLAILFSFPLFFMGTVVLLIIGAVIADMLLGMVWYLPQTFGAMWMKDAKVETPANPKKAMVTAMSMSALSYAVLATVLWYVQYMLGFAALRYFLAGIVILWVPFVLCFRLIHSLFEGKNLRYVAITAIHDLLALLITGSIVYAA